VLAPVRAVATGEARGGGWVVDFKSTFDGRGVPQNLEAERSVLGALLLHADTVCDVNFLRPEDFYLPRHQLIFQSIISSSGVLSC